MLHSELVGLIPAAGKASRLSPLPCSKEIYPVGFQSAGVNHSIRPKVASQYLLESMRLAGVQKAFIVLRSGKWDIPAYLGDGTLLDMHLAYLIVNQSFGVPFTLDQAYPFIENKRVAFGFPDIIFRPEDAFNKMVDRQGATGADLVLGLFPTNRPQTADMVELDQRGQVIRIVVKPGETSLRYAWVIAIWGPVFTRFMHTYLAALLTKGEPLREKEELFVGDIIQAAIEDGLRIDVVLFPKGSYVDIGTPEGLHEAIRKYR